MTTIERVSTTDMTTYRWIGVYPNGEYKTGIWEEADLLSGIEYNTTLRPGRALVVNGHTIYHGLGVSDKRLAGAIARVAAHPAVPMLDLRMILTSYEGAVQEANDSPDDEEIVADLETKREALMRVLRLALEQTT